VRRFLSIGLFLFTLSCNSQAQVLIDSLEAENIEVDTVIIKEDPLIYTKTLVIEQVKTVKLYASAYAGVFTTVNYYSPCENCEAFLKQYRSSIRSRNSYSYGLELAYVPKKIIWSIGAAYSVIKEEFDYTSPNGAHFSANNSLSHLEIKATTGYWLRRGKKNISFLLHGGIVYSRLIQSEGLLNSYTDAENVVSINDAGKLRPNQYNLTLGIKTILLPARRIKVFIEPYYQGSLLNTTKDYFPYSQYYNLFGMKAGVMFSL
jgi:hypothetical protein